jgi:replicative DNA helicase
MGDDSTPRTVSSLARGRDKMYDIIPSGNPQEKYTVNEEHILCLQESTSKSKEIVEITVKDYLKLSEEKKAMLKGYRVAVEFPRKEYHENCHEYVHNEELRTNSAYLFGLSLEHPIIEKTIPLKYKVESRKIRLNLLAGIVDALGSYYPMEHQFIMRQDNEILAKDIQFLARSLGFHTILRNSHFLLEETFAIIISGDLAKIPTDKFEVFSENIKPDVLSYGIEVKYAREDEYYGFTLNGNNRYIMGDFTVTHNTCSAIGITEEMRLYLKQVGMRKKILIVASPNVQENFKTQLFDANKLQEIGKKGSGIWNLEIFSI